MPWRESGFRTERRPHQPAAGEEKPEGGQSLAPQHGDDLLDAGADENRERGGGNERRRRADEDRPLGGARRSDAHGGELGFIAELSQEDRAERGEQNFPIHPQGLTRPTANVECIEAYASLRIIIIEERDAEAVKRHIG